jgi:hypothetical protein
MLTFLEYLNEEASTDMTLDFKEFGSWLNDALKQYNYQVAPLAPAGKPGKNVKSQREYRLQLINKSNDTSDKLIPALGKILKTSDGVSGLKFNQVSPNSSKFPSYSFTSSGKAVDLVIGRGANKGENFETQTVANLAQVFGKTSKSPEFLKLIQLMNAANPAFASVEIASVKQRTGSTKKENVPIEKLGAIIGDIVLKDTSGKEWFISLKDSNGNTFSSYSGAASIFDMSGSLQKSSPGIEFLEAFGTDLNQVQKGFDIRNKIVTIRELRQVKSANAGEIKKIFERAWGMNYFYVRKLSSGWKVFWLDRAKLDSMAGGIKVDEIRYPNEKSKQISIYCSNSHYKYMIELRNSKGGEYPNDTKFKIL